ncbi:MAG TPA: hypothetical protein VFA94_07785 [Acidimicrobiales bacterium]|nr:hypothetical protein [Acidimicrobiales bacterium]
MLKRNLAVLLVAGLVVAGGAVAWAEGGGARPSFLAGTSGDATTRTTLDATAKAQLKTCLQQARADKDRAAAQKCLSDAGITRRPGRGAAPAGTLGRVVHGDVIVRTKNGFENLTVDRGTLDAKDANSVTVKRPDGPSVTVKVDDKTRYRGAGSLANLQTGQPVSVVSKDGTALIVAQGRGQAGAGPAGPGAKAGPGAHPSSDTNPGDGLGDLTTI